MTNKNAFTWLVVVVCLCWTNCGFATRSSFSLKITGPPDGSVVSGPFSVKVEFSHSFSYLELDSFGDEFPSSFEVTLDGHSDVKIALSNRSWSYYVLNFAGLEKGIHFIEAAVLQEGADIAGSPEWVGGSFHVSDRVRYTSKGPDPAPPPTPHMKFDGALSVMLRKRMQVDETGALSWPRSPESNGSVRVVEVPELWPANETAILVLDMWHHHGCRSASLRLSAMVDRMNQVLVDARDRGVMIIFSPVIRTIDACT